MKKLLASLAFVLSLTPALAFAEGKPIEVIATSSILGDLAKQVGGDLVHVKTLVGPDGDAHTYRPTPNDSKALSEAALVIANGLSTEVEPTATQVAKLIEQMKAEKVRRVFFENMASPKLIKQLAKDGGASVGKPVYSYALSKMGSPAASLHGAVGITLPAIAYR